jgi:hypothetical protein
MSYVLTHFFPNGTEDQYKATVAAVHPKDGLPAGQTFHAAGPADGGWLVVALWDSKESSDRFVAETLVPALSKTQGALQGPPQEHAAPAAFLQQA